MAKIVIEDKWNPGSALFWVSSGELITDNKKPQLSLSNQCGTSLLAENTS